MANRKFYQVVLSYYDRPGEKVLKTFSSRKKAEEFVDDYLETDESEEDGYDCIDVKEYKVE